MVFFLTRASCFPAELFALAAGVIFGGVNAAVWFETLNGVTFLLEEGFLAVAMSSTFQRRPWD